MTQKEFEAKYNLIEEQFKELSRQKQQLLKEHEASLNEPYKHLFEKKVKVTYKPDNYYTTKTLATRILFFERYHIHGTQPVPHFYNVKKNGERSLNRFRFSPWEEFVSFEAYEEDKVEE